MRVFNLFENETLPLYLCVWVPLVWNIWKSILCIDFILDLLSLVTGANTLYTSCLQLKPYVSQCTSEVASTEAV